MREGIINVNGVNYPYQIIKTKNKTIRVTFIDGIFIIKSSEKYYQTLDIPKIYATNAKLFEKLVKVKQLTYKYEVGEVINLFDNKYQIVPSLENGVYGLSVHVNFNKNIKNEFFKATSKLIINYFKTRTTYFHELYFKSKPLPGVKVQVMTSRYGVYHSRNHYITYSAYLAHYPLDLIDYVIVHELCHIFVLSHSKEFYGLLASVLPNYKELEKRMKEMRYIPTC